MLGVNVGVNVAVNVAVNSRQRIFLYLFPGIDLPLSELKNLALDLPSFIRD